MRWLSSLLTRMQQPLRRLGVCANAGILVGMIAGGVTTVLHFLHGLHGLALADAFRIWVLLALFCWLTLLFVFVALIRWSARSVAAPALINATLVTAATVSVSWLFMLYAWAVLIGIAAGLAIGQALCRLSTMFSRR